jgi:hypothetical protein
VVQAADFMCSGGACCRHSGTVRHVKGMRGEKFVRTLALGAELDKEVVVQRAQACQRIVPTWCRALSPGAWHRHHGHSSAGEQWWHSGVKQPDGGTRRDTTAQDGRHTGNQCYGAEVASGGQRSGGNHGGNASERAAGEDLREEGPTGGSRLPVTEARAW